MKLSRRRFVLASVAGVMGVRAPLASSGTLRLAIVADDGDPALRRAVRFGVDEARHSARLFDWKIEAEETADGRVDEALVDAIIVAGRAVPSAARIPVVRLTPWQGSLAPNELAIHPGGETLGRVRARHAVSDAPAPERRVVVWHDALQRFGAAQLNDRFRASLGAGDSAGWLGWFAVKCLWETAARARSAAAEQLLARMRHRGTRYDGHKGMPLRFDERGELLQPVYVVERVPTAPGGIDRWMIVAEEMP